MLLQWIFELHQNNYVNGVCEVLKVRAEAKRSNNT
jgi:hypothetical protein